MKTLKISNVVYVAMLLYSMATNGQTLYVPGGTVGTSSNGNVGIGTTGPTSLLHVKHPTGNLTTRFEGLSNLYSSKMYLSSVSSGDGGMMYDAATNLSNIFSYGDLRFNVGTANISGSIGNERMVILQGGNVGIGTSAPQGKLEIQNGDDVSGSRIRLNYQEIKIIDRYNNNDYTGKIWAQWPGYGILNFGINDSYGSDVTTPALSIRGSGNVGIGTTGPSNMLQIEKSTSSTGIPTTSATDSKYRLLISNPQLINNATYAIGFTSYGGSAVAYIASDTYYNGQYESNISFGTRDDGSGGLTEKVRIDNQGNVGIGIINPLRKLHIESNIARAGFTGKSGSEVLIVGNTADNNWTAVDLVSDGYAKIGVLKTVSGTTMSFGTSNNYTTGITNQALNIIPSGNVGIGTVTPTQKLTVNGKILAEEVEVIADVLPDYVFKEDYKLMSLAELDKFIKANKHLPEVPSEKEVCDNGSKIGLGEMNHILLKKIEELTLYAIEQENNTKDQKENIKEQKENSQKQDETIKSLLKRVAELEKQ